ncbi:MAG: hypothetical protein JNK65_05240, partial [Deltaproteobacteria bacterium]|nr:hypothetical protein [Deltaproteobacteria bacterium]
MLPIVIGGAAAMFFLAGCASKKENPSNQEQPLPASPSASSSAQEAAEDQAPINPETIPQNYTLDFDSKSKAFHFFEQLKKAGVSERDLDQGYTDLEFASKKEVLLK